MMDMKNQTLLIIILIVSGTISGAMSNLKILNYIDISRLDMVSQEAINIDLDLTDMTMNEVVDFIATQSNYISIGLTNTCNITTLEIIHYKYIINWNVNNAKTGLFVKDPCITYIVMLDDPINNSVFDIFNKLMNH